MCESILTLTKRLEGHFAPEHGTLKASLTRHIEEFISYIVNDVLKIYLGGPPLVLAQGSMLANELVKSILGKTCSMLGGYLEKYFEQQT